MSWTAEWPLLEAVLEVTGQVDPAQLMEGHDPTSSFFMEGLTRADWELAWRTENLSIAFTQPSSSVMGEMTKTHLTWLFSCVPNVDYCMFVLGFPDLPGSHRWTKNENAVIYTERWDIAWGWGHISCHSCLTINLRGQKKKRLWGMDNKTP